MYSPKHFKSQELVPPEIFHSRGQYSLELIDERVLITLDRLRERFGVCIVNNWHLDGNYKYSGFRTPESECYSPTSQHSFGRAMDCKFKGISAAEIRAAVIRDRLEFPWITFIEDEVNWFHFDVRNTQPIKLWSPSTRVITQV